MFKTSDARHAARCAERGSKAEGASKAKLGQHGTAQARGPGVRMLQRRDKVQRVLRRRSKQTERDGATGEGQLARLTSDAVGSHSAPLDSDQRRR